MFRNTPVLRNRNDVISAAINPVLVPVQEKIAHVTWQGIASQTVVKPLLVVGAEGTVDTPNGKGKRFRVIKIKGDEVQVQQLSVRTGEPIKGKTCTLPITKFNVG